MLNKILFSSFFSLILFFTSLSAYDLKSNMLLLNAELSEVQRAFITSNQQGVINSIKRFASHAKELLKI